MRRTVGIVITLLFMLSPTYPLHAQGIRAGGFGTRGIGGGIRGARVGAIGSARLGTVSNFRGGFSQAGSSSSFRGNSVGIGNGMANSRISQRGFGQNISHASASFSSSSNLTGSTLGKRISNPRLQFIPNSPSNTMAPVNREPVRLGSRLINRARSKLRATDTSFVKTNLNSVSSNNIGSTSRGLNNRIIADKRASLISKKLNSNRHQNLRSRLSGIEGSVKRDNEVSIASAGNRDILHWVDRNNGIKHYTNNINSIPEEAKTTTLVDGQSPRLVSRSSERTRNVRNVQPRFREASLATTDKTANLVMEKTVEFPGQRRRFAAGRDHERINIHNSNHSKGFDHFKGFDNTDRHEFHHHDFHHTRFFPLDPFLFNNSFFFISPVFPVSSFFFVNNAFQPFPIFPSPFFGFQPFFVPAVPIVFIPVFPQFTTFTPFIDPFLLNPFFSPFLFGTDFFSTSIAFNNFF